MMGQQPRMESLFYYFRLEDQILEDHLFRLTDRSVEFRLVRERLQNFYSPTRRPSINPEVLLRLLPTTRHQSPANRTLTADAFRRRSSCRPAPPSLATAVEGDVVSRPAPRGT